MSSFPACRHKTHKTRATPRDGLRWLAAEPYRIFFFSGALWSVIGVSLWPLFYAQRLGFFPNVVHARIMIEAFGAAFAVGFLGTAGPRMATAPRLTPQELVWLFTLHQACGVAHLLGRTTWGDTFFIAMLASLLSSLLIRVVKFRREMPPPQMLLAVIGLACGIAGASLLLSPSIQSNPQDLRLANLLLDQGLLLPAVLGIGSFVFPRMLGGNFGEPANPAQARAKLTRSIAAGALLVGSFFLEAHGFVLPGCILRAGVMVGYLLVEVRWRKSPDNAPRGTLTSGLIWAMFLGPLGLVLSGFFHAQAQRIAAEHLLYTGGFGLLILVVASRVLFGHSGDLGGFFVRSHWVRFLILLGILTAATRAIPAWLPSTSVSHHIYAASSWSLLVLLWLFWHRRRFVTREEE